MAKRIVSIPHKFRLAGAISFRKDYSPHSSMPSRPYSGLGDRPPHCRATGPPEATHALELLACTSVSHQCCVRSSIPINHLLPPNSEEHGTVITCVSGSTRNPRCSHLYIEPKLLYRGLSMALDVHLKAEMSTPFGPYKCLLHLVHTKYYSYQKTLKTASCSTYLYITKYLSSHTLYFTTLFNHPYKLSTNFNYNI